MARILVVDDSAVVRRMLGFVLGDAGHEVSFAVNGEQGLEATRSARPDLVISDLEMPVMDGIAFVRELKGEAATPAIPVIMLTASGEADLHRAAADVGVDGFATKPVRSTEVMELVRDLLSRPAE
jgi:two-component system, chemotaxis family, chemotaxis protein CheY